MDIWVCVTRSAPLTDFSGDNATVRDPLAAVGTIDVDTEGGIWTAFSTFVEEVAELVEVACLEAGSQVDASVSGAGDVVTVTVSILLVVVPLADGVEGGALQNTETAGGPVTGTVFTGVSVTTSTDLAEANSGETFGAVTLRCVSAGGDRVVSAADEELTDAVEVSGMGGHGVERVCDELTAEGTEVTVDCVDAVERLAAVAFWATVGAQVRAAEEETDACSTDVVSELLSAARDVRVSAEGQNEVAEAGDSAVDDTVSQTTLSAGVEAMADGC